MAHPTITTRPSVTPESTSLHWNLEPLMAWQSHNMEVCLIWVLTVVFSVFFIIWNIPFYEFFIPFWPSKSFALTQGWNVSQCSWPVSWQLLWIPQVPLCPILPPLVFPNDSNSNLNGCECVGRTGRRMVPGNILFPSLNTTSSSTNLVSASASCLQCLAYVFGQRVSCHQLCIYLSIAK